MARRANPVKTVQLRISTTPQVQGLLEKLVAHGTYGRNASEAAERLITDKLNDMMGQQALGHMLLMESQKMMAGEEVES